MNMKTVANAAAALCLAAGLACPGPLFAQAPLRPTPTEVNSVFVQGVGQVTVFTYRAQFVSADPATRRVVLELPNGRRWAVIAPPIIGDLTAFENGQTLIISVAPGEVTGLGKARQGRPGELVNEVALNAGLPGWPEGFGVREVTITTIFVDINKQNGTVTFEGLDGVVRTMKAANPNVLADLQQVEPGDLAQISYLEGLTINAIR
ncbi:hypothetical protein V5F59_10970 [Xanthobacter autotrophicus DSM 431]|uniref:hypothetical protein n=1 Tax=Xanthobacter nonsaccharivorans TaxID=3119912 RepID=UPI0037297531